MTVQLLFSVSSSGGGQWKNAGRKSHTGSIMGAIGVKYTKQHGGVPEQVRVGKSVGKTGWEGTSCLGGIRDYGRSCCQICSPMPESPTQVILDLNQRLS